MRKFIISILSLLIIGCDSEIIDQQEQPVPYWSFNIGDVKQYYVENWNYHTIFEVIGDTTRTDGLEVFVIRTSIQIPNYYTLTSFQYLFMRDNYVFETQLDTVTEYDSIKFNPYHEFRVAKLYPSSGDIFQTNMGAPDSLKEFYSIKIIDSLDTYVMAFQDVAQQTLISNDSTEVFRNYLAKKYGHICSYINDGVIESVFLLNYINFNGVAWGAYVPYNNNIVVELDSKFFSDKYRVPF